MAVRDQLTPFTARAAVLILGTLTAVIFKTVRSEKAVDG